MDIRIDSLRFCWAHSGFKLCVPSLHIASGASVAVVGPSGSGKTTFLKLLAGIEEPTEGSIQFDDIILTKQSEYQRRALRQRSVGYVFQDFKLIEYLSVEDNIMTPWRLSECQNHVKSTIHQRVAEMTDALGLTMLLDRSVQQLSQGERQRTAIARALLLKPGLVLADEPTGNLDPDNKRVVRDLMLNEISRQQSTLIMVTHDRNLVDGFDRVIDFADFQTKGVPLPKAL